MTYEEWNMEGERLFGPNRMKWRFVCPSCGHVASIQDWKDAGATEKQAAFSCIGRNLRSKKEMFDKTGGPCNYAGGGLIGINPVTVIDGDRTHRLFAFAEGK